MGGALVKKKKVLQGPNAPTVHLAGWEKLLKQPVKVIGEKQWTETLDKIAVYGITEEIAYNKLYLRFVDVRQGPNQVRDFSPHPPV
jgi:hypothetical protein